MTGEAWCVEVKDIVILVSTQGVAWWLTFRHRFEPMGRVVSIPGTATPQGDYCLVACDNREEAESLAEHMVTFGGVPRTAVRARRAPSEATP